MLPDRWPHQHPVGAKTLRPVRDAEYPLRDAEHPLVGESGLLHSFSEFGPRKA